MSINKQLCYWRVAKGECSGGPAQMSANDVVPTESLAADPTLVLLEDDQSRS